jgi:hypothetical protein
MQLTASRQAPGLFQVRLGCIFERPIGQKWTRSLRLFAMSLAVEFVHKPFEEFLRLP